MWKRRNERLADPCINETDRYGGGASLMVWGGISGLYCTDLVVIQGNLNGVRYRDEILQQQVEPFMQNHPEVEMFQHDNTRPHTASLHSNLQSPLASAQLKTCGHCSVIRSRSEITPSRNLEELTVALQEEWQAIPQRTS